MRWNGERLEAPSIAKAESDERLRDGVDMVG